MTFRVVVELAGPPRGKGRPRTMIRGQHAHIYTDGETAKYEAQLKYAAKQVMGDREPTAQPVSVLMTVRFAIPTSWSQKKQAAAVIGHVRPTVKPDADNTLKLCDAINGVVFLDDKQVVDARVIKLYSRTPGLLIEIDSIPPPELPPINTSAQQGPADLFTGSAACPPEDRGPVAIPVPDRVGPLFDPLPVP